MKGFFFALALTCLPTFAVASNFIAQQALGIDEVNDTGQVIASGTADFYAYMRGSGPGIGSFRVVIRNGSSTVTRNFEVRGQEGDLYIGVEDSSAPIPYQIQVEENPVTMELKIWIYERDPPFSDLHMYVGTYYEVNVRT